MREKSGLWAAVIWGLTGIAAVGGGRADSTIAGTELSPPAVSGALELQARLDRAHFSPGEIDGTWGKNSKRALAAFEQFGRDAENAAGGADQTSDAALVSYVIQEADVAGPFQAIPDDMLEKAQLDALGYGSPLEALAEMFHSSPELLRALNPQADFALAGETIWAPNVARAPLPKVARVVVDRSDYSVAAFDASGRMIARYPASMGSPHDPLPLGQWKVNGVRKSPIFRYDPDLFWDAKEHHQQAEIAAGPNNPVGVVWIDLSKEHLGVHGTPEPSRVGTTQSHGCIRLTNWDAQELAEMVAPGLPVVLQE